MTAGDAALADRIAAALAACGPLTAAAAADLAGALAHPCCPPPKGCGQPAGDWCVSLAAGRFAGERTSRLHVCRRLKAGQPLPDAPPPPDAEQRRRRSETAAGQRRAQQGRHDWARDGER